MEVTRHECGWVSWGRSNEIVTHFFDLPHNTVYFTRNYINGTMTWLVFKNGIQIKYCRGCYRED